MSNKTNELIKKHSFLEVFFKTAGIPILAMIVIALIGLGFYLNKKIVFAIFIGIAVIVSAVFLTVCILTMFSFLIARFKSYLKVRYLPVNKEEIEKLNIQNIDDYFYYIQDFLKVKYVNYFYKFSKK